MTLLKTSPAVLPTLFLSACAVTGPVSPAPTPQVNSAPIASPAPQSGLEAGYDEGFYIRSDDGRKELAFEGLFQTVIGVYEDDRDPDSDVILKRMRPEFAGKFDALRFRLEPRFTDHDVELEEAWAGTKLGEHDLLMIGRMKAPFGLEEVRSRRHIDFPNFSIINQFSPAEDDGIFLNGRSASQVWEYGIAAYNGTGTSDTNSSKDVAARVMMHPFVADSDSSFQNLQFGLAATIGNQDESVADDAIKGPAGLDVVRFASGSRLDGNRTRLSVEAAWFRGPWMVQSELVAVDQEMEADGGDPDVAIRGAYLTISRALTGEAKSFKGVRPDIPFDFETGSGRGAWIAALRLSRLDLDDDLDDDGVVESDTFTDGIDGISLGLNWVPNEHAIVRNSLVLSRFDDDVRLDRGTDDQELAFLIEFQMHF